MFGRKGATKPQAAIEFRSEGRKQIRGWKDYAFYAVVGLAVFFTIGFLAIIFESPEKREARAAERALTIQRLQAEAEERADARREAERIANRPPLKINSWSCSKEYGFAKVHGMVTNRSNKSIDRLMVTAIYKTSGGDIVKSSDALVDFQPLLPGQQSPFSTLTTDNPAIKNCGILFRTMFGSEVKSEE